MELSTLTIIVNSILITISLVLVSLMLRYGVLYGVNYGDSTVQGRLRWKILRIIMALIVIGLIASVYDIVVPYLLQ